MIRFYIEAMAISLGIVHLIAVIPIQVFVFEQVHLISILSGGILWYTIIFHNQTFWKIIDNSSVDCVYNKLKRDHASLIQ